MKYIVETSNGVESTLTQEQWDKVKNDSRYSGTFSLVRTVEVPKELVSGTSESRQYEKSDKKPQDKTTQDKTK